MKSPRKDLSQYYKIELFSVPFSSRLVIFSTQKCVGCQRGGGAQPIDYPSEQLHDLWIKIKDHQDERMTKVWSVYRPQDPEQES